MSEDIFDFYFDYKPIENGSFQDDLEALIKDWEKILGKPLSNGE